jgi:hypothetical protein
MARQEQERDLSASLYDFTANTLNRVVDFMAERRGLPQLVAFLLVLLNFFCQFVPALGWFAEYDVLLHLGVLLAISGSLLAAVL